jgi:hypothetical protein
VFTLVVDAFRIEEVGSYSLAWRID